MAVEIVINLHILRLILDSWCSGLHSSGEERSRAGIATERRTVLRDCAVGIDRGDNLLLLHGKPKLISFSHL